MKTIAWMAITLFAAGTLACGGAEKTNDPAPTEEPAEQTQRQIEPAASGGMERGFDDEAEGFDDEPAADPEAGGDLPE